MGTGDHQEHDAELVARARRGDRGAFAKLFERHAGAVRTTARGHLRDPEAAEDVVQEAFTRAFARLHTLRADDRFRPWLLQITRNASAEVRQRRQRVSIEPLDESASEGVVPVADELAPDDAAELRELVAQVRDGVAGLSPRDATALSMVLWLGFGPAEVGAALGISPNAAKVMLHRARQRLRDALLAEVAGRDGCLEAAALVDAGATQEVLAHVRSCDRCDQLGREHFAVGRPD